MHVAAVDDQVMRHRIGRRFLVTQLDKRADEGTRLRRKLDPDEAVVMGARIGGDDEIAGGNQLRHRRCMRRLHVAARLRQLAG